MQFSNLDMIWLFLHKATATDGDVTTLLQSSNLARNDLTELWKKKYDYEALQEQMGATL